MRIEHGNRINISSSYKISKFLKGLKPGAELDVKVLERMDRKSALLEIRGNKFRADFLKGVPGNNRLLLKYEGFKSDSFMFKLIDVTSKSGFIEKALEHTIWTVENIDKSNFMNIGKFLSASITSIFELNILLAGMKLVKKGGNSEMSQLLNYLMNKGYSLKSLQNLAFILSSFEINKNFLPIFLLLNFDKNYFKDWHSENDDIKENLNKMFSDVDKIKELEDSGKIIKKLLDFIVVSVDRDRTQAHEGEILYHDGNDFKSLNYIGLDDSWIFSVDFTNLGKIDILLKKIGNIINISIFAENNEISNALKEGNFLLFEKLYEINKNIKLQIHNKCGILDKLKEINLYYSLNSEIDIKI